MPLSSRPTVIIVTTVRDEAWTLDRFLHTCSLFADHILVDDDSTAIDGSRSIYPRYPKVRVHDGRGLSFEQRRKRTFAEARQIPAQKRIIVALDSDELLSGNVLGSPEWKTVLAAPPGTCFFVHRYDLWGTAAHYRDEAKIPGLWVSDRTIWVDDGVSDIAEKGYKGMHMAYTPENDHPIRLHQIACLHYQFCHPNKVRSRYRFYRAHEKANIGRLDDLAIWRHYSQHEIPTPTLPCPREWFSGWEESGIDMTSTSEEDLFHYDIDVLRLLAKNGPALFGRQDIWFANWAALRRKAVERGHLPPEFPEIPPFKRSLGDRLFHIYARRTNSSWRLKQWEQRLPRRRQ